MKVITPFRYLLGIICLVMTLLIFLAMLSGVYDRLKNSECGIKCGFVIEKQVVINPLDWILVQSSKVFPLDYVVFLCLVFYIFICALYGIIKLGIKIFCFTLYEIKKESTVPQALLIMAFLIQLILMVVVAQINVLTP